MLVLSCFIHLIWRPGSALASILSRFFFSYPATRRLGSFACVPNFLVYYGGLRFGYDAFVYILNRGGKGCEVKNYFSAWGGSVLAEGRAPRARESARDMRNKDVMTSSVRAVLSWCLDYWMFCSPTLCLIAWLGTQPVLPQLRRAPAEAYSLAGPFSSRLLRETGASLVPVEECDGRRAALDASQRPQPSNTGPDGELVRDACAPVLHAGCWLA
ncbi:hypothetical protein PSPO01_04753 [Paraphaeosphaeria sporulosa]